MANNVFGNPITDDTLRGMPEYYRKTTTRLDRAHVALLKKNIENKDLNARQYVEELKRESGDGVSTLCVLYNATGDPVTFVTNHDYYGHIGQAPYPWQIANGQWGGFLHVKTSGAATGSSAAIVYRGLNEAGADSDWMLAWSNPWNRSYDTKVYTEIRDGKYYDDGSHWSSISGLIDTSGNITHKAGWNTCMSYASTGDYTSPVMEIIMTLKDA